jgi:hypothetical protein
LTKMTRGCKQREGYAGSWCCVARMSIITVYISCVRCPSSCLITEALQGGNVPCPLPVHNCEVCPRRGYAGLDIKETEDCFLVYIDSFWAGGQRFGAAWYVGVIHLSIALLSCGRREPSFCGMLGGIKRPRAAIAQSCPVFVHQSSELVAWLLMAEAFAFLRRRCAQ